jgi:hypothetical protein
MQEELNRESGSLFACLFVCLLEGDFVRECVYLRSHIVL